MQWIVVILLFIIASVLFPPLLLVIPVILILGALGLVINAGTSLITFFTNRREPTAVTPHQSANQNAATPLQLAQSTAATPRQPVHRVNPVIVKAAHEEFLAFLNAQLGRGIPAETLEQVFAEQWNLRFQIAGRRLKMNDATIRAAELKMPQIRAYFDQVVVEN